MSLSAYSLGASIYSAFQAAVVQSERLSPRMAREADKTTLLFSLIDLGLICVGIGALSQRIPASWRHPPSLAFLNSSWNDPWFTTPSLTALSCGITYVWHKLQPTGDFKTEMEELR